MVAITISRQYGSGGRKIATQVANTLNYDFFDKSLMVDVARDIGISETELVDFTEEDYQSRGFFARLLGASQNVATITRRTRDASGTEQRLMTKLDAEGAVDLVRTAVRAAYERGNVVIVGRGGQHILQDKPDVFHVRVIAPSSTRRQRLVEIEDYKSYDAISIIDEKDKANQEYHRRFYNANLDDPMLYHLIINTGKITAENAAQLIVNSYQQFLKAIAAPTVTVSSI